MKVLRPIWGRQDWSGCQLNLQIFKSLLPVSGPFEFRILLEYFRERYGSFGLSFYESPIVANTSQETPDFLHIRWRKKSKHSLYLVHVDL
jgi:hypothetical protein